MQQQSGQARSNTLGKHAATQSASTQQQRGQARSQGERLWGAALCGGIAGKSEVPHATSPPRLASPRISSCVLARSGTACEHAAPSCEHARGGSMLARCPLSHAREMGISWRARDPSFSGSCQCSSPCDVGIAAQVALARTGRDRTPARARSLPVPGTAQSRRPRSIRAPARRGGAVRPMLRDRKRVLLPTTTKSLLPGACSRPEESDFGARVSGGRSGGAEEGLLCRLLRRSM